MIDSVWFVLAIVLVALIFDFINGFHDAANSIATVVSTRVLSPFAAVVWAAGAVGRDAVWRGARLRLDRAGRILRREQ